MKEKFEYIIESGRPENLRLKELEQKGFDNLSEEEKAELYGLRAFLDNPRGAELQKKETLGLINEEEREELRRLHQLKTREKDFSPEIQKLWERTEANDSDVEQVYMNNEKSGVRTKKNPPKADSQLPKTR